MIKTQEMKVITFEVLRIHLKKAFNTNTTKILKTKKIKFQKINLILRTYVALNVHYCLLQQYHQKMLTRTRDMISASNHLIWLINSLLIIY
jgi:hypothetical protein